MSECLTSREELARAACADCGKRLTTEQADLGAEYFKCACGCTELRLRNGDRLVELPDP